MSEGLSAPRPRIGLSCCISPADPERGVYPGKTLLYVEQSMVRWIAADDALVYPVPPVPPSAPGGPAAWVDDLDGLVLHGGSDVAPGSYGSIPLRSDWEGDPVRDAYELDLVRRFLDAGKPVLGICRGAQLLNVAFGGTLWQDLVEQGATTTTHTDRVIYDGLLHEIDVEPESWLARVLGAPGRCLVNSIHHQGLRELAPGLEVQARSARDGLVEAVRAIEGSWCVGVQWHPELSDRSDPTMLDDAPIRASFLDAARGNRGDTETQEP